MDRLPSAATDEAERVDGLNRGETLEGGGGREERMSLHWEETTSRGHLKIHVPLVRGSGMTIAR